MSNKKIHLALNTADLSRSVKFYEALFGVKPTKLKEKYAKFDLIEPAVNFTLNQVERVEGNHISHLGIQVKTSKEVFSEKSRLETLGLKTLLEEDVDCCYALQDKVWVKDPDGNAWEIFVVLQEGENRKSENSTCCA